MRFLRDKAKLRITKLDGTTDVLIIRPGVPLFIQMDFNVVDKETGREVHVMTREVKVELIP